MQLSQSSLPEPKTLGELFESVVQVYPEAIALQSQIAQLTYEELNQIVNRLAHYLILRGMGPGSRVAVMLPRSFELLVGILGIAKAGCAFIPIDLAYPDLRIQSILEGSNPDLILVHSALRPGLKLDFSKVIQLKEVLYKDLPSTNLEVRCSPTDVAYIIFTSGSTGSPKGVEVEHKGMAALAQYQAKAFKAGPGRRVLQYAPIGFDAFVWEISMSLLNGGILFILEQEKVLPSHELTRIIEEESIHIVTLPPSNLSLLPPPKQLNCLDTLIVAGEACEPPLAARWQVGRNFFNAYGPTEATICSSVYQVKEIDPKQVITPIGKPISGTEVYILDSEGKLASPGTVGEIYIGGIGVARGYYHNLEATQRHFIPNHIEPEKSPTLYRSYDYGRWNTEGEIEFIGRRDSQIKLNGVRIDIGDIHCNLRIILPEIQAVETVKVEDPESSFLATALISSSPVSDSILRKELLERLPGAMVPKMIWYVNEMPMTPNGKVDHRKLSEMAMERSKAERLRHSLADTLTVYTGNEVKIHTLWKEILRHTNFSHHDSFFDAGGTSLELVRLHRALDLEFPGLFRLADLFKYVTIAQISNYIDEHNFAESTEDSIVLEV